MSVKPAGLARGGRRPAGLRVVVPGWAQWAWGEPERARAFFGTSVASLVMAAFAWGTRLGVALLVLAFVAHVAAAADAVRRGAFPGFGRWVPTVSAVAGLGFVGYAPVLALATLVAWPGDRLGAPQDGYLVNRWAYAAEPPGRGDWVWFAAADGRGHGVTQVLAGPGQEVEWADNRLRIGGEVSPWKPSRTAATPSRLAFTVPKDHVLLVSATGLGGETSCGMALVPCEQVAGRAWARMYPIWERGLL